MAGSSSTFKWTDECQKAFEEAKRMISRETILAYADFSKTFHIHTDASDYQLGGVIMQDGRPLAFYTRKLNSAQMRYTTGEQELLSIVEILKTFETILLGQRIVVHTDHKNLLYSKQPSNRLYRWRMLIEEFGPELVHIKGEKNVVADALSRLDMDKRTYDELEEQAYYTYVTKEDIEEEVFPMAPFVIAKHQQRDKSLKKAAQTNKDYGIVTLEGYDLITYKGRISIPRILKNKLIGWYHEYLVHPGDRRMEETIKQHFTWKKLREDVEAHVKTCRKCQLTKKPKKKYGHLPARQADTVPWKRVNVDLIGPYTVKTPSKEHTFRAMTMIDPATGWFEIAPIIDPNSEETQRVFDSYWLSRYPRPQECGIDGGSEFKYLFKELCRNYGIKQKPSTSYNPQGNSILERVHQVIGNALRSFELHNEDLNEVNPFEPFMTATAFAIRSTYHTTLEATPGQLVFGRDMLLPIAFKADWARIAQQKQKRIDDSNERENRTRQPYDYKVGDKVLLAVPGIKGKLSTPRTGPYEVTQVHTNGTLHIRKGVVTQRVNIRRVTPYHESNPSGSE